MLTNGDVFRRIKNQGICMHHHFKRLSVLLGLLAFAGSGYAAPVVYSYTGNTFDSITDNNPPAGTYTTSMSVSGSFTIADSTLFPAPNSPLIDISGDLVAWSFFDGINTLTEADSNIQIRVSTDGAGAIDEWAIIINSNELVAPDTSLAQIYTVVTDAQQRDFGVNRVCPFASCEAGDQVFDSGVILNSPGAWQTTVVPLPASAWLMLSALGMLIGVSRRKRKLIA
jgi:hypothetical protein